MKKIQALISLQITLFTATSTFGNNSNLEKGSIDKGNPVEQIHSLTESATDINTPDENGRTLLHWAAYWGDPDTVEGLIEKGANVNAQDKSGQTPLHYATEEIVVNEKNSEGEDAIVDEAFNNRIKVLYILLESGANSDIQDEYEQTGLHLLSVGTHPEVIQLRKGLLQYSR